MQGRSPPCRDLLESERASDRMTNPIRFQKPSLPSLAHVQRYFAMSEERRWYSNFGPCVELLEARLSDYVGGGARCITVTNGTLGLMVSLREAALTGPERRFVVVPTFTFAATAAAISWSGYQLLLVDV